VVQTHHECEFLARRDLSAMGHLVALPMFRAPTKLKSYDGRGKPTPLFEGYVFVKMTDRWHSAQHARGVSHVLMNCMRPSLIADDVVQFFTDVSVDRNGYYIDPVMKRYVVGEIVTPARGRLAGIPVTLASLDADGRCSFLFSMMGREVRAKGQVDELA
jgi:transcription antitermination factor NusG